jgi:hypothetical protein
MKGVCCAGIVLPFAFSRVSLIIVSSWLNAFLITFCRLLFFDQSVNRESAKPTMVPARVPTIPNMPESSLILEPLVCLLLMCRFRISVSALLELFCEFQNSFHEQASNKNVEDVEVEKARYYIFDS